MVVAYVSHLFIAIREKFEAVTAVPKERKTEVFVSQEGRSAKSLQNGECAKGKPSLQKRSAKTVKMTIAMAKSTKDAKIPPLHQGQVSHFGL